MEHWEPCSGAPEEPGRPFPEALVAPAEEVSVAALAALAVPLVRPAVWVWGEVGSPVVSGPLPEAVVLGRRGQGPVVRVVLGPVE